MNPPRSNYFLATLKRHQLLTITLVVLVASAIFLVSSSDAQHRASKERTRSTKSKSKTPGASPTDKDLDLARLANRPFNPALRRQDAMETLQPISSPAVRFAESLPLSEVA